jgi:hypothetical protein
MNTNMQEAVELLSNGGILQKLKDDVQAQREAERAGLLVKLAAAEKQLTIDGPRAAKKRLELEALVERRTAELAEAKRELNATPWASDHQVQKLQGQLVKLSDPRLQAALAQLIVFTRQTHEAFRTSSHTVRLLGKKAVEVSSNSEQTAEILSSIRQARSRLEAMQVQAAPVDMDAEIGALITPIRDAVRKLAGFA